MKKSNIRVFISYCHDANVNHKVIILANRLCTEGINCIIDEYENHPSEGWPKWMAKQNREADYVLVISTKKYFDGSLNTDKSGKGVQFETVLSYNDFYQNHSENEKYIPVVFTDDDLKYIPEPLQSFTYYNVGKIEGYDLLYRRITHQPSISQPIIGKEKKRPQSEINLRTIHSNSKIEFSMSQANEDEDLNGSVDGNTLIDVKDVEIDIILNRDFNSYSEKDKDKFLSAIKVFLEVDKGVRISHMRKGSVILTLELAPELREKLHWAIKSGKFKEINVVDSILLEKTETKDCSESETEHYFINLDQIHGGIIYSNEEVIETSIQYFMGDELAARVWANKYALKDSFGNLFEKTPDDMHRRLARELHRVELKYKNPLSEELIYSVLKDFKYIVPQGGPMTGIANDYQIASLSNCFVIGNDDTSDSYAGIIKIDQELVHLMKRRGGVGHDLSHISPIGTPVLNSALTSPGVVPFMEIYSNSTREVAQDGRRGALMLSISIKHPDSGKFIDAKLESGKVTGANVSVKLTDDFMKAVEDKTLFRQQYPINSDNPRFAKDIDAVQLWSKIIHNAWKSAEPGVLFWDTIIRESVPDCYADLGYATVSTNPCGEIPLCPYDSCRLLAINLFSYVNNPFTKEAEFDTELYKEHVGLAQRMMDDIIDLELEKIDAIIAKINADPEVEELKRVERNLWTNIRTKAVEGRRTGIGITAEGDMLAGLGLRYGSDEATSFSVDIHKTLALEAYKSSTYLAKERGPFAIYDAEREKNNPFVLRMKEADPVMYNNMVKFGRRNIALLTIAPTGTTSLMTQTTSGIEPIFSVFYKRRRKVNPNDQDVKVSFKDEVGDSWEEFIVFHHKFVDWLRLNGYDVDEVTRMRDEEIEAIIAKSPYYKATANDVDWIAKVKMQGAIQKWVDHSISVTINLPAEAKEELISELYLTAWKSGCKGATVYRDGSRNGVLIAGKADIRPERPRRPKVLDCDVIRFNINEEKWVALVGLKESKPYEIFTGMADEDIFPIPKGIVKGKIIKIKDEAGYNRYDFQFIDKYGYKKTIGGLSHTFAPEFWNYAKLISGVLRHEMPIQDVVNLISSLRFDSESLKNWKNGVERALEKYIPNGTRGKGKCGECGSDNLVYEEGCLICKDCGSTRCA